MTNGFRWLGIQCCLLHAKFGVAAKTGTQWLNNMSAMMAFRVRAKGCNAKVHIYTHTYRRDPYGPFKCVHMWHFGAFVVTERRDRAPRHKGSCAGIVFYWRRYLRLINSRLHVEVLLLSRKSFAHRWYRRWYNIHAVNWCCMCGVWRTRWSPKWIADKQTTRLALVRWVGETHHQIC